MGVVGDPTDAGGSREGSSVGEAPSLAIRLQDPPAPNSVLIAEGTRRLVGELFEYQAVEVMGIAGPVPAWQVFRPRVIASRFEALRGSALTRLVGRDEEIDLLSAAGRVPRPATVKSSWSRANPVSTKGKREAAAS